MPLTLTIPRELLFEESLGLDRAFYQMSEPKTTVLLRLRSFSNGNVSTDSSKIRSGIELQLGFVRPGSYSIKLQYICRVYH